MANKEPQRIVLDSEETFALWNEGREAWNAYVEVNPDDGLEPIDENGFHLVLKGAAAMALWREGKEAWNAWVLANVFADIDFSKQHFEGELASAAAVKSLIDFTGFLFPIGNVSFESATFGTSYVSFHGAIFIKGDVIFNFATFGEGIINFNSARFGKCEIKFIGTIFGDGDLWFKDVIFGDSSLSVDYATLNKGGVSFEGASFGPGTVSLRNLAFEGVARFDGLRQLEHCTQFSFEGSSFDKLFIFSHHGRMGCPLDLRRTRLSHGIVLNDVKCDYPKTPGWLWRSKAADPQDSQRFRRLKELAQNENNRAKALEFNAQELRSQRGHESHPLQDFLQFFYMLLSDYGRSVVRPLVALGVVTGLFGALYAQLSTKLAFGAALPAGVTYSGGNMFAFVPIGRNALEQSRLDLFGKDLPVPYELLWIGGFQSVLSVILLFLLGLGLRNMFRL